MRKGWPTYVLKAEGLFQVIGTFEYAIASSVYFMGHTCDTDGNNWSIVLEWNDPDGVNHQGKVPWGNVGKVKPLLSAGLTIYNSNLFKQYLEYLMCERTDKYSA